MMAALGILAGAALGTRYKVFCLLPAMLAGAAVLVALDRLNQAPFSSTALSALALAVGLQVGYPVGAVVCSLLPALAGNVSRPQCPRGRAARIS
jgi:hypothetical protein